MNQVFIQFCCILFMYVLANIVTSCLRVSMEVWKLTIFIYKSLCLH